MPSIELYKTVAEVNKALREVQALDEAQEISFNEELSSLRQVIADMKEEKCSLENDYKALNASIYHERSGVSKLALTEGFFKDIDDIPKFVQRTIDSLQNLINEVKDAGEILTPSRTAGAREYITKTAEHVRTPTQVPEKSTLTREQIDSIMTNQKYLVETLGEIYDSKVKDVSHQEIFHYDDEDDEEAESDDGAEKEAE